MKICVVGAGAMGCLMGGYLARAGHEVWLVSRSKDQAAILASRGLTVHRDGAVETIPVNATINPADIGICDVVLVMTKFRDTRSAMEAALPTVGPDTSVVTLQNGIGNVEQLRAVVGGNPIFFGVTTSGAIRPQPGEIEVTALDSTKTYVWSLDDRTSPSLESFVEAMTAAGFDICAAPDVKQRIWQKLCLNAGVSSVCAAIGIKAGVLADLAPARQLSRYIVAEIAAVANEEGINLDSQVIYESLIDECRQHPNHAPSILVDVASGRKTEVDCLNGAVVEFGERYDIPTPYNRMLVLMLSAIERSYDRRFSI